MILRQGKDSSNLYYCKTEISYDYSLHTAAMPSAKMREWAVYGLLATLFLLLAFAALVVLHFALPRPNLLFLGTVIDFPSKATPYRVVIDEYPTFLYIVHLDDQWLAIDPRTPHVGHCRVRWEAHTEESIETGSYSHFEDPCSGSNFALNGGYLEGPAWNHLARYPIVIKNENQLYVNLTVTVKETKNEFLYRCEIAQDWAARGAITDLTRRSFCQRYWSWAIGDRTQIP